MMKNNIKKLALVASITLSLIGASVYVARAQETSTGSTEVEKETDEIRERVQEKIEEIQKNPRAYLGGVTDITDSTLQVRNVDGEILQISVDEDTTYSNTTTDDDDIEISDIALGDFVVAMGYLDSTNVLMATRILVSEELAATNRTAIQGVVEDNDTTGITLPTPDGDIVVDPVRNVDVTSVQDGEIIDARLSDVEDFDTIIAVGPLEGDTLEARKIQIVKKADLEITESETTTIEE